jgi:cytoskeleton protein RodZ
MDSEDETGAGNAPEADATAAGAQLRAAREAKRLELSHIAAETRIPLRHLEAIEAGNFESLPSRAYAIGFSRTFARAVGLDDVQITEAVRAELADGTMRRNVSSEGMEPGDPAKLPSAGLAWAGAFAALVLAVGAIAFFNAYFGAGTGPGSLISPTPATPPAGIAAAAPEAGTAPAPASTDAPVTGGTVVLTATADGIWLRLSEAGGERLLERTLKQGEQVTVPAAAADPRINTGRPDALSITIGGKSVARLSDRPVTLADAPVSAAALLARAAPSPVAAATNATSAAVAASTRPAVRRPASTVTGNGAGVQAGSTRRATTAVPDRAAPAIVTPASAPPSSAPSPQPAANAPAESPVSAPAGDDPAT